MVLVRKPEVASDDNYTKTFIQLLNLLTSELRHLIKISSF